MRVWLDDEREMPPHYTHHAKTAKEAIDFLKTGRVKRLSFDHDLGPGADTGYDVAKWIEKEVRDNPHFPLPRMSVHTMNPVGRRNICHALQNAHRIAMGRN